MVLHSLMAPNQHDPNRNVLHTIRLTCCTIISWLVHLYADSAGSRHPLWLIWNKIWIKIRKFSRKEITYSHRERQTAADRHPLALVLVNFPLMSNGWQFRSLMAGCYCCCPAIIKFHCGRKSLADTAGPRRERASLLVHAAEVAIVKVLL